MSHFIFDQADNRLFLPKAVKAPGLGTFKINFFDQFFQNNKEAPPSLRLYADYDKLWPDEDFDLRQTFLRHSFHEWLEFLCFFGDIYPNEFTSQNLQLEYFQSLLQGPTFNNHIEFMKQKHAYPYPPNYYTLVAARFAASICPIGNGIFKPFTIQSIDNLLRGIYQVLTTIDRAEGQLAGDIFGLSAAYNERTDNVHGALLISRAYGFWLGAHLRPNSKATACKARFEQVLIERTGCNLEDWIIGVGILYMKKVSETPRRIRDQAPSFIHFRNSEFKDEKVGVFEKILKNLSGSPIELQQSYRTNSADLFDCMSLVPIKSRPIVRLPGDIFDILAPLQLAESAFDTPINLRFASESEGQRPSDDFSKLFESYVHGILATLYGERYLQIPEGMEKRADGIIVYGDSCILLEFKGAQTSQNRLWVPRSNKKYLNELRSGKMKAASEQLRQTAIEIAAGRLRMEGLPRSIRLIANLTVVYKAAPLALLMHADDGEFFFDDFEEKGIQIMKPQVIQLAEIERLEVYASRVSIIQALIEKSHDPEYKDEYLFNFLKHRYGSAMYMDTGNIQQLAKLSESWAK